MSGLPSLGLGPCSLSEYTSLAYARPDISPTASGFTLDAAFYTPQYPAGSVRMIEFRPTGEVTFYTEEDKPHSCFYSGVIRDNNNVQVVLSDPHHDESNRCERIIREYGRHFFDRGVSLDLHKMQVSIKGEYYKPPADIYKHGKLREEPGYCVGLGRDRTKMDCTFAGKTGDISFHLDGKVDIFNDKNEQVTCKYEVKANNKVTFRECEKSSSESLAGIVKFIAEDASLDLHPLTLIIKEEDEYCYQPNEYVYKQVQWESAFYDVNRVRVRDGVRMDCDFTADEGKFDIVTFSFKRNGSVTVMGHKKVYEGVYVATYSPKMGKIVINASELRIASKSSAGRSLASLRSAETLALPSMVVKNKAMMRMEINFHGKGMATYTSGGDCRAFERSTVRG
ncbi:hypothetical protein FOZ62_030550 [Perkinsus olseni]|nr:hypothetical protein FOZ62_030550 [Perkinsus olseni]